MTVTWEVLDSVEAVEATVPEWDRLAVAANLPYCAPAWLLGWFRHAAPERARLRVVAVREGDRLVGLGPFYAVPWGGALWTWSLMGTDTTSRIEPLAAPGRASDVGTALAAALAAGGPPVGRIRLEGLPSGSPWPHVLRTGWPGRRQPWYHRQPATPAPTISLAGMPDADVFLASRSSNFRQQMRRARRKLDTDGFSFRVASGPAEIERDLRAFERLHNARWDFRGGSTALTPGTVEMLADVGRELAGEGRFLLVSLERDGVVVNSQLFVAAGDEISYWNGGFDDDYAAYKPSMVALVEALRMACERGFRRFDLGPGAQEYKYRFTDDEDSLVWQTLIPVGPRFAPARALYAPREARHALGQRLTPEQKQRLRGLLRRETD